MPEWLNHPATIVIGIGALATAIVKISLWAGGVNADLRSLKESVGEIRKTVEKILSQLSPRTTVASASPLKLTELGRKVSEELGAAALAETLAPALQARIEGLDPYSIQELCYDYVRSEYKPPEEVETGIRLLAFDNGIDRDQVVNVVAIELRDRLLVLAGHKPPR